MIGTVINYCSNDYRCLKMCIDEAKKFSSHIVVPVCDHFFDGKAENRHLLNHSYARHRDVSFVEYQFDRTTPYGIAPRIKPDDEDWIHYWHSTSRYVGYHFLPKEVEYILFLDVDEVVEGKRFLKWIKQFPYQDYNAIFYSAAFYFREAAYRAEQNFRSSLFVKRDELSPELLLDVDERKGTFRSMSGEKLDLVLGADELPLVHHYSWVKPQDELRRKVCWGHSGETDWDQKIAHEFSEPFRGSDTIWNLSYDRVTPPHDPLSITVPREDYIPTSEFHPNVQVVDRKDILRLTVDLS